MDGAEGCECADLGRLGADYLCGFDDGVPARRGGGGWSDGGKEVGEWGRVGEEVVAKGEEREVGREAVVWAGYVRSEVEHASS